MSADRRSRPRRGRATWPPSLVLAAVVAGCAAVPQATVAPVGTPAPSSTGVTTAPGNPGGPTEIPAAAPGHELYGFLPYWEIDDPGIAEHVASLPLTTLALFSVTHTAKGAINTNARGHPSITGESGRAMIADAQARGTRVELVYTSFGAAR